MSETTSRVRLIFDGSERGVVAAAAKSAAAIRGLKDENTQVGKSFAAADQRASKFIGTLTKTAAITSLVGAGGGLIGQAFAGALPAVTALGVAAGTVALGWDGVKKAVQGAKKPFDDLKAAVSGTFEKSLQQPVQAVAGLLPKLTAGFQGVAASVSGLVAQIVQVGTSAEGVSKLQSILAGTRVFVDGMAPGLAKLVDGFLTLSANATPSMRELGAAVGDVFGKLGDVLRNMPFDTVNAAVRGFSATLKGLGSVIAAVVDLAVKGGAAFGDSFGVVFDNLAKAISNATPGFVDLGGALGELLRAAAPLLPVIGDLAGQFAHALADGIRAVIPYVTAFADWAKNNVGTIKAIVEAIVALAVGVKALSFFTSVVGWVDGVVGAFGRLGGGAATAEKSAGSLITKLGGFKTLGIAAAIGAAAFAIDDLNIKAAGGADKLTGLNENLHDLRLLLSGEWGNPFEAINQQLEDTKTNIVTGRSLFGEFLGFIKRSLTETLPPINFDVNTGPAHQQVVDFMNSLKGQVGTVNINGRTEDAAQAVANLIQLIDRDPGAMVTINGQTIPAKDALKLLIEQINNSFPEVMINGRYEKAGDALAQFLGIANKSEATAGLNANPAKAVETVGGWQRFAEGTTGQATLAANPAPANATVAGWKGSADATLGRSTLDANPAPAFSRTTGWKGDADRTLGRSTLDANRQPANAQTGGWVGDANRARGRATLEADPGPARNTLLGFLAEWGHKILTWTVRTIFGAAEGGPVVNGRAGGGPIRGPGTGTSDTAGLWALSNGEHVLTAREVQAAGGHAAIFALRKSLVKGRVPRMSATSGRAGSGGAVTSAGALAMPAPQVNVQVHVDGNEVRSLVRTEIINSNRSTRRTVLSGAGTSY